LGDKATDYLIDLWLTVAEERPLGILTGWDERDIALAAGYPNDPAKLVEALTDSKLLEKNGDGIYRLHDWEDHQPWAIGATERSNLGRIAAMKRWHPNSDGMPTACQPHTDGNAPYPSPYPSPLPKPSKNVDSQFLDSMKALFPGVDVSLEWQHCQVWCTEKRKTPSPSRLMAWLKKAKPSQLQDPKGMDEEPWLTR
jgi:hypothetical protein